MLKLDSFVFSGAPRTRMVSFPCNASTNCSTVYTRSKLVACRTHLVSGSYSFFSSLSPHPTGIAKGSSFSTLLLVPRAGTAPTSPQPEPLPTAGRQQHQQHIRRTSMVREQQVPETFQGTTEKLTNFAHPP